MFRHINLRSSEVLNGLGDRGPDPRFFSEVFEYIKSEMINDVVWPPLPNTKQWFLVVEKITAKLNAIHERTFTLDEHITNYIVRYNRVGGVLVPPDTTGSGACLADNLSRLDISRYDVQSQNYNIMDRLLVWFSQLRDENNNDYYFSFDDYRKPKLYSALTRQEYSPLTDIDEDDFRSFKRGYTLIQRVMLRIRHWPS